MKKILIAASIFVLAFMAFGCRASNNLEEEEPYNRSQKASYERKIRYSVFAPFMYEDKFYSYYALAKKLQGPDKKGFYSVEFTNGPKEGEVITTDNVILKTRPADAYELKKGMVVLVNHWDPKQHNDNTKTDMWRKGVVYNLDKLSDDKVMLEFPHDRNDFMATKEVYSLQNIRIIVEPQVRDIRVFLD